jgi:hypothetical protein
MATGLVLLFATALTSMGGAPAQAAPKPPTPNAVTITGPGMPKPITVSADADPLLLAALLDQVSWLSGGGYRASPANVDLGPKYTVTVLINNAPSRTYDLYPLASGGPRAYRPAKQPGRTVAAAWFFGRLTMPEALQAAGAPLSGLTDAGTGGIGGGSRVLAERADKADQNMDSLVGQLRGLLLLNVAVILIITTGLAAIARFIRRRTG